MLKVYHETNNPLATTSNQTIGSSVSTDNSVIISSGANASAPISTLQTQERISVAGLSNQFSTTEFFDDKNVVKYDESHYATIDNTILSMNDSQQVMSDIKAYLAKPLPVRSGTFNITDTLSFFDTLSVPYGAFTGALSDVWTAKLKGFFGIRMDMRFKLVVNANKFQQGRYIMGYTQLGGATQTLTNIKQGIFNNSHNATLVQRTTVPHVEIDLSTDTSAELFVPFVSAYSFYPLNTLTSAVDLNVLGYLNIYPYSPLIAPTGSTSCGYTVYMTMENISLYGAASPQADIDFGKKEMGIKFNGPVSGIARGIANGFREFSDVPLLGSYAKGISWISDRIAVTASIFGFSKPTSGDSIPKMQLLSAPSHSTVDGDSDARTLSYLNRPGVVPLKGLAGTDIDEMDFSFIKSKYAWFNTSTWDTTQVSDTQIKLIDITPTTGVYSVTKFGAPTFSYAPVSFVARQFKWWRGSIKMKFKIVKTEYHSGRLSFAFYPTDETEYTSNPVYVNRMIVDIRENTEIEIVLPYISRKPWTKFADKIGQLRVKVIDPLVAPSSVSPNVTILMEIAGGDDFEVAGITSLELMPTSFVPQSDVQRIASTTIGNSSVHSNPHIMTALTIGDKVSSFRAMAKRFIPIIKTGTNATSTMNTSGITFLTDATLSWEGNYIVPANWFTADFISLISSCYTFMSGGIRIRDNIDFGLTDVNVGKLHTSVVAILDTDESINTSSIILDLSPAVTPRNYHRVLNETSNNNTITVEVPQYTSTFTRCIIDTTIYQGDTVASYRQYTPNSSASSNVVQIRCPSGITVTPVTAHTYHRVYRAGADDFNLSGFISIPPMFTNNGTTNSSNY